MMPFVDYGHGGNDSGGIGINSILEKNVNLMVGERLTYHLKRHKITVVETRKGDTNPSLSARVEEIKRTGCTFGISIHCNTVENSSARGYETYTWGTGSKEMELANCIHNQIIGDGLYSLNRGIKQDKWHILSHNIPCVLVELGFLTNESDKALILENIEKFAISLCKGMLKFIGREYVEEKQPNQEKLYSVQVGVYSNYVNAENMKKQLSDLGIIGIIKTIQ